MLREIRASGLQPGDTFSRTAQDGFDWHTAEKVLRECTGPTAWTDVMAANGQWFCYTPAVTVWIEERGERWMR